MDWYNKAFDETSKYFIKLPNKVYGETKPIERFVKLAKHLTKQQNI